MLKLNLSRIPQQAASSPNYLLGRLLNSPSLVAIGLSVGYETWPPIGWHHAFVIDWSKYRLGLPSAPLHYGLTWPVGILTIFQTPVTVPLYSLNARHFGRQMPAVGLCMGTVKSTGPTHAKLVSLTSPCCSRWPCPMNTLKANNGPLDPGVGDERFFRFKRNAWNF